MTSEEITQVVDYYRSDFSDLVYYFDSMEELRNLTLSEELANSKNVAKMGPVKMEKVQRETLDGWTALFRDEIGYTLV